MDEEVKYVDVVRQGYSTIDQICVDKPWLLYSVKFAYFIKAKFSAN